MGASQPSRTTGTNFLYNWGEPERVPPSTVRSTGEISVCMYNVHVCMYGKFGRLNLDASTRYNFWFTSIRALMRLNQRRVRTCMRFSHIGHAAW